MLRTKAMSRGLSTILASLTAVLRLGLWRGATEWASLQPEISSSMKNSLIIIESVFGSKSVSCVYVK